MKKVFSVLLLAVAHIVALAATSVAATLPTLPKADSSWEEVSNDEGVLVHRKDVEGTSLVAFRGETTIDASLAKVANVLIDTSRKKEWVHKIVEAKDVRNINQFERVEYNHTSSGFFAVRDRDFVFHAKAELNRDKRQMHFSLRSVADELMPETDKVRGEISNSRYILTEVAPNKTHVVVEIQADPKGSVPKWLVNLFQKSWPRRSLNGIRAQCAKTDVAEHAEIRDYFAQAVASDTATPEQPTATTPATKAARGGTASGVQKTGPGALK